MKIPELLAPVGDYECLIAAVLGGANAVYFGGKDFNARNNASNFDENEIIKAIDFAHMYNVKVHIVVNILLFENEIQDFIDFIKLIYNAGVDAVIVQDMGAIYLINQLFPDLDVHLSTQATIVNSEAVKLLEKQNIKRIVLGRELSIKEIKEIKEETNVELEVFAHGALCMSYSGKCLMSSFIGGRSGNRGKCAQPCRLKYKLQSENSDEELEEGYLLSTKDVSTIDILPELVQTGVASLKIEGRMKRPEYVYNVVSIYRKYLDLIEESLRKHNKIIDYKVSEKDNDTLLMTFNRGGFSKGYLKPENKKFVTPDKCNNWGIEIGRVIDVSKSSKKVKVLLKKDVSRLDGIEIWDGKTSGTGKILDVLYDDDNNKIEFAKHGQIVQIYFKDVDKIKKNDLVYKTFSQNIKNQWEKAKLQGTKKINISAEFKAKIGEKAQLILSDSQNSISIYSDELVQEAIKAETSIEKIKANLQKTGDTLFEINSININIERGIFIPLSSINDMRRKACIKLEESKKDTYRRMFRNCLNIYDILDIDKANENKEQKVIVDVYNLHQFMSVLDMNINVIYYDADSFINDIKEKDIIKLCNEKNIKLFIKIMHVFKQEKLVLLYNYIDNIILQLKKDGHSVGLVFNDLGVCGYLKSKVSDAQCIADFGMNISNSYAVKAYKLLGVNGATISVESTLGNIKKIEQNTIGFGFEKNIYVHGYIPFMISEYCLASQQYDNNIKNNKCLFKCKNNYVIIDRMGKESIVKNNKLCQTIIYNSEVIYSADKMNEFKKNNIQNIRIDLQFWDIDKTADLVNSYILPFKNYRKFEPSEVKFKFTRGYYGK